MQARTLRSIALGAVAILTVLPVLGAQQTPTIRTVDRRVPNDAFIPVVPEPVLPAIDYLRLDNHEGNQVGLLFPPVRPMALDGDLLYAVNTYGNTVGVWDVSSGVSTDPTPVFFDVPWGPVSVAVWDSPNIAVDNLGDKELLVVCRGTYTLARLDSLTGTVLKILELPAEPADIVVDSVRHRAWIACSAVDKVVEVNLLGNSILRVHDIPSKHPRFLTLLNDALLATPTLSGNNSTADEGILELDVGPARVLDLDDPQVATSGLPDQDLFRMRSNLNQVTPVATGLGTTLFQHAVNPATDELWILNTEANNKDATRMGEAAIRGEVVFNRVTMVPMKASGLAVGNSPSRIVYLDDTDDTTPGIQYDPDRSVGQPHSLAFESNGDGFICGMLTNNVVELDSNGDFKREWNVGSIPRGLMLTSSGNELLVYCWGTNTIEGWQIANAVPQKIRTLDLGHDPSRLAVQVGRRLFFDAGHSMHNNASCASCHIDGASDMAVWDLSDLVYDDKRAMLTQTLEGIEELLPYHWRGERADLIDFNAAFDLLLGGPPLSETPGGQFDRFQEFVFSLRGPANPFEDLRRIISNKRLPERMATDAYAAAAQNLFFFQPTVGSNTCEACHMLPTGTANDIVHDEFGLEDNFRNHFKVTPFNFTWRKFQSSHHTIELVGGETIQRPTLGAGISHAGRKLSIGQFAGNPAFLVDEQEAKNLGAYLTQLDTGLAPAVHRAFFVGRGNDIIATDVQVVAPLPAPVLQPSDPDVFTSQFAPVVNYLLPQAAKRNCDIVVFGVVDLGNGPVQMRWVWDRDEGEFIPEDSSVQPVKAQFFAQQAIAGKGQNVFMGVPVGMGRPFAVDYDNDMLFNEDEVALGTSPYDRDTDKDGFPDGQEVENGGNPLDQLVLPIDTTDPVIDELRLVYRTTRVAKIAFDTDELARWRVTYGPIGRGDAQQVRSGEVLGTNHTIFLRDLEPKTDYQVLVTAIDPSNNSSSMPLTDGLRTRREIAQFDTVVTELKDSILTDTGGVLEVQLDATLLKKNGAIADDKQLVIDVLVNDQLTQTGLLGSPADANGLSVLIFSESGLNPGDRVVAKVTGTLNSQGTSTQNWSMPDTPPENRLREAFYTGP